ncbi:MAG TPA: thiamine pyrophosphate-dependent enzyme, partial [Dehalococcoidia bacterium]|nr:thiamine pyrophosphate-dependent enzyme [Dehalococcoidia bacterium]
IDLEADAIVGIGVRHGGSGTPNDYKIFEGVKKIAAVGPDVEIFENIPGLDLAVMADESRTLERLLELATREYESEGYDDRREASLRIARRLRSERRVALQPATEIPGRVRPLTLLDTVDSELENLGGGVITTEQFAVPLEDVLEKSSGGNNTYIRPAGGSEGYGMGAVLGAKLAVPDRPVVGIVGDGSVYYSDSAFWSAAQHEIPVLYVVPNNGAYGIVAGAFGRANGVMKDTGVYAGVVLDGADIVQLAGSFGVEGRRVDDESKMAEAVKEGLETVEREGRPMLLDVQLPLGLPEGGKASRQVKFSDMT